MIEQLLETSTLISSSSVLIPLAIALIRFKQLSQTQKLIGYLVMTATIVELMANLLWFSQMRNLVVYNSFAIINFNFILLIYVKRLDKLWKKILTYLMIVFNAFFLIDTLLIKKIENYQYYLNSNITTAASLIYIAIGIKYFSKLLKEVKYQKLEKNPLFWFSSGIILYYSGALILFLLSNQVSTNPEEYSLYYEIALAGWGLNSVFNLILNSAYTIALWVSPIK